MIFDNEQQLRKGTYCINRGVSLLNAEEMEEIAFKASRIC